MASSNGSTPCDNRFTAASQYFSFISFHTARMPASFAATRVVPLPMNGSTTDATPSTSDTHHDITASGFCVG